MRRLFVFALFVSAPAFNLQAQSPCPAPGERVISAQERLATNPQGEDLEAVYRYLVAATKSCYGSGELWHLRNLVEKRLKKSAKDLEFSEKRMAGLANRFREQPYDPFAQAPQGAVPPFVQKKWALIIGIGDFQDAKISPLRFTGKDANDLKAALTNPKIGRFEPNNVHVLLNEQATHQGIRDQMAWLHHNAKPEDLVLIYISSHGSPKTLDLAGEGLSYIVTHDTMLDSLYARSYPMVDLVNHVSRDILARRVVLLVDACHSGSAVKPDTVRAASKSLAAEAAAPAETVNTSFAMLRTSTGRAVLLSSRAEETSWENQKLDAGKGNGYFTRAFIDALKEKDGLLPLKDIFAKVESQVTTDVQAQLGKPQHPIFQASESGADIILGVEPKAK